MRRYFPLTAAFTLCLAAPLAAGAQSVQPPPTGQPSSYVLDTEQLLGKRTLSLDPSVTTAPPAETPTTVAVPTTKKKAAAKKKATPTTVAARILDPATAPTTLASTTIASTTEAAATTAPKRVAWTPPTATKTTDSKAPDTKAPDAKSAPKATDSAAPDTEANNSTDASGIPGSVWAALRKCESGGNYAINTGNGFYGAYQFAAATWRALGYPGLPHEAPPAMQDEAARKLQVKQGWGAWPACTRKLGLR